MSGRNRPRGGAVRGLLAVLLLGLAACRGLSPLTNRISPGAEPFLVLVGEGPGGQTDLYAGSAGGGELVRLTFTRDVEWAPALDPTGAVVAFLRRSPVSGRDDAYVVLMNLVNGAERVALVPAELGPADRIGWARDGRSVFVRGEHGIGVTPAPPGPMALMIIPPNDVQGGAADSALGVLLGDPPAARVESCPADSTEPGRYCVATGTGERQVLAGDVHDPFPWGADSLGYLEEGRLMARPLGGGRARRVAWGNPPANPRQPTYHGGPPPAP